MTLQFHPGRKRSGVSNSKPAPVAAALPSTEACGTEAPPVACSAALAMRLDELRAAMVEAVNSGRPQEADHLSVQALAVARKEGNPLDIERFECIRANILVGLGRTQEAASNMRKLLLRSTDTANRFAASYAIAQHHYAVNENERSLFFARQALRYAEERGEPELLATGNNLMATLLLRESYFAEAGVCFEEALKFYPAGYERAGIQANLGYCLTVTGKVTLAFRQLTSSLRTMNRLKLGGWRRFPHLALAYAYVEIGRYQRAVQHAARSLEISQATPGAEEQWKNSLYLLGEAKKLGGRDAEAWEHFTALQKNFYPDQPFIVDVLMATDVRKMINLMS